PIAITLPLFGSLGGAPQVWGRGDEVRLVWLQNAGFVWVPMILLAAWAAWAAWRFGNNVASARISPKEQLKALRVPHTWRVCMLYMGSYGTFLGFA
ncbi:nitrite extrusion protein, partial [Laribacter hongkongensis]|nr:nitrite extrusion protein [Laribacter hongkongensis]